VFFFSFYLCLFCCFYFPFDNIANVHFIKRRVISTCCCFINAININNIYINKVNVYQKIPHRAKKLISSLSDGYGFFKIFVSKAFR
jgi:hypothetical protein